MTTSQIAERVQIEADAHFGDTIERLLLLLRNRHTHQCWRKECSCEYCRFINGQYVDEKMKLHTLKKRIRYYEYFSQLTKGELSNMLSVEVAAARQREWLHFLKEHKKDLQRNIV